MQTSSQDRELLSFFTHRTRQLSTLRFHLQNALNFERDSLSLSGIAEPASGSLKNKHLKFRFRAHSLNPDCYRGSEMAADALLAVACGGCGSAVASLHRLLHAKKAADFKCSIRHKRQRIAFSLYLPIFGEETDLQGREWDASNWKALSCSPVWPLQRLWWIEHWHCCLVNNSKTNARF